MKTLSKYSNLEKSAGLHCRLAAACAVVLLAFSVAPRAQGATITDYNQGRYDLNNQASGASGPLANYIVGTQNGIPDPSATPPIRAFHTISPTSLLSIWQELFLALSPRLR